MRAIVCVSNGRRRPLAIGVLLSAFVVGSHALLQRSSVHDAVGETTRPYTVRVNTFKREKCLKKVIAAWQTCAPAQIRIVWSEGEDQIPQWLHQLVERQAVAIDVYPSSNLTNRFIPENFITDIVFSVDDDVVYSCKTMEMAAAMLKKDPHKMVGFAPHLLDTPYLLDTERSEGDEEKPLSGMMAWMTGRANTILPTKGAFMHKDMYEAFFSPKFKHLRDEIDEHITGEDFLMAYLHASWSHLPPIPLALGAGDSEEFECGNALTTGGERADERSAVLLEIATHFGDVFKGLETDVLLLNTTSRTMAPIRSLDPAALVGDSGLPPEESGLQLCCDQHQHCCEARDRAIEEAKNAIKEAKRASKKAKK